MRMCSFVARLGHSVPCLGYKTSKQNQCLDLSTLTLATGSGLRQNHADQFTQGRWLGQRSPLRQAHAMKVVGAAKVVGATVSATRVGAPYVVGAAMVEVPMNGAAAIV